MEYPKVCIIDEEKKDRKTIKIPKERLVEIKGEGENSPYVGVPMYNNEEELDGKAIYLDNEYDWIIARTESNTLCCIPLKKEEQR